MWIKSDTNASEGGREGRGRVLFFLMIRRPPRSTQSRSSAASDVYKRQGKKNVAGAHGIVVSADEIFENADNMGQDMIVLPGGMPGTRYLGEHNGLRKVLMDFAEKGKPIAAICAAPSILGKLGLLDKKEAVCYPGFEKTLKGAAIGRNIV